MKNRSFVLFFISIFFCQSSVIYAFDLKSMFTSMGSGFGAPPVGYFYSCEVISDASVPIYLEQQGIASFMGAFFPSAKGYYGHETLPSIFDAGGQISQAGYSKAQYYFKMSIGTSANAHANAIYRKSLTELPFLKNDPNVFYFHVYTAGKFAKGNFIHVPQVEEMGYQNPTQINDPQSKTKGNVLLTSQLSALNFSNSSGTDVQISLMYGEDPYTFTLEKYSYNKLVVPTPKAPKSASTGMEGLKASGTPADKENKENNVKIQAALNIKASTATADYEKNKMSQAEKESSADEAPATPPLFSLRPNSLSFYEVGKKSPFRSFRLAEKGFDGYAYTIEVFQDINKPLEVGIQGLNPGNYDIGAISRVRDLTPCPCTFWYQSFEQAGSVEGYSNLPGQIWVVYNGADSQFQSKVTPGQVVSWNLVRPLIDQGDQFVYFVYIATTDDAIAQKFVAKLAAQTIGKDVIQQYYQATQKPVVFTAVDQSLDVSDKNTKIAQLTMSPEQEVATLMGSLNVTSGAIEDTEQGIVGYLVGADAFTSFGSGFGRFYYILGPSILSVSNIVSLVSGCLDSSKIASFGSDPEASITRTVTGWLASYIKKPADVEQQVQQYLIGYGNSKIVAADGTGLTKFGKLCLQSIISGKVSLKYPSLKPSTVTNQYVYDFGRSEPEKMPEGNIVQLKPLRLQAPAQKSPTSKK